jgi:HEAT repeat protein
MRQDRVLLTLVLIIGAGLFLLLATPILVRLGMAWSDERHVVFLINDLNSNDALTREWAALALGKMGPKAEGAIPSLIKTLRSRKPLTRPNMEGILSFEDRAPDKARAALVQIGSAAIPALTRALEDDDPLTRVLAGWALWELKKEPNKVIPILVAAFRDHNAFRADECVRWRARDALSAIGREHPDAVLPVLSELQKDDDEEISYPAATALRDIEQATKTAK